MQRHLRRSEDHYDMRCMIPNDFVPKARTRVYRVRIMIQFIKCAATIILLYFPNGLETLKTASASRPCRRKNDSTSGPADERETFQAFFSPSINTPLVFLLLLFLFFNSRVANGTRRATPSPSIPYYIITAVGPRDFQ